MPINNRELLAAVSQLTELQSMRVTIRESGKWALITSASVLTGGLLLGPVGLALGGIVGGCTGALKTRGKFIKLNLCYIINIDLCNSSKNFRSFSISSRYYYE